MTDSGETNASYSPEQVSVIIPFYNEQDNVASVLSELVASQPAAEIIAVDDGSTDATWQELQRIEGIICLRLPGNRGQSAAMLTGLNKSTREICITMDGDGQNDPADIGRVLSHLGHHDAVFGIRKERNDSWDRRLASKIANSIRRWLINDGISDTGCSLKAFRREMVASLPPVNGVHRFMGAYFKARGYSIEQIPVNHRPRNLGTSKYTNIDRAMRGLYDLVGVRWYLKRRIEIE